MTRSPCPTLLLLLALAAMLNCLTAHAKEASSSAAQLYKSGQWQQAVAEFDRLAKMELPGATGRLTAQLYAGECLVQLGKYAEARQRYEAVQQQAPPTRLAAQALFRLGEVAWLSNETTEARTLLQSFVEKYPQHDSAGYARDYLQQLQQRVASQENFEVLDEAVGWERSGRHDAALAAYHRLLQQPLGKQVRGETLRRAARLHERLSQSREALQLYREFLTDNPHSRQTAEVLTSVAWLHVRLDQPTQAAEQFRAVHTKFPQSPQAVEAAYWLAQTSADNQDSGPATRYVDWLLAQEKLPTQRPRLWGKALCLKCQLVAAEGQWLKIDALADRAELSEEPERTKLEFWAAEAAFRQRKYNLSRDRFNKLASKTLGINEPWTAMIPLRRAQLSARRQQWGEVLKRLDQLESDFPKFELDYEVDYLRGRALAGRGAMTAARKFYQRVLDNRLAAETEAAAMAGWMIGETFFHQRDYPRARRAYQTVMEQPAWPEWRSRAALQAGKCWELEHHWDEAAKVYEHALGTWPNSNSEPEIESRLRWAQSQATQHR